ncbi:hypothetical protein J9332_44825, partial [Aquimarina celericrescens]|nr:hypothetical protein [Aquimarina celericrescens]
NGTTRMVEYINRRRKTKVLKNMEDETEKMRAELLEFIATCEDEILLEQILEAAKKCHNEKD